MSKRKEPVSDRVVEFILTRKLNELGQLTETTLADAMGVSLPYLVRKFKKAQKIDLNDFIIREKIHTAMFLLETQQGFSVEELAEKLGFSKLHQFVDAFKNYIAADPLTYQDLKSNPSSSLKLNN
jgi:AraC-like DNA-binding protein